ncbi:MAG: hypothetical protein EB157_02740, partial [Euryarchaeota archaeon]|nr:hypothetical protein [Euryarchaeota archaeon]
TNLFCAVQDTDATLEYYLASGDWSHKRRTAEQWDDWAKKGASGKCVTNHPDLFTEDGRSGPLTYEVELYQGCVRFKRGCKFCIEPKKGVPIWRDEDDVIAEITTALDNGVRHVRIGGATDIYTYKADGVVELEYPIPNPEPISKVLSGLREDERLEILHVDNANPSIVAENLEPATEITKSLISTLSDGAVLSFGLESADPRVHETNWLNCDSEQLKFIVKDTGIGMSEAEEMFPIGTELKGIWWEAHDDRIRRPEQILDKTHRDASIYGRAGITFGRQIGAYPILVGTPYQVPLETESDIIVTGHGMRSLSGVETNLSINTASQSQLEAIPGIGSKAAWRIVSNRAKALRKFPENPFSDVKTALQDAGVQSYGLALKVLKA